MRKLTRTIVTALLPLAVLAGTGAGAAAATGLGITATAARLGADGTTVVLSGTYTCGPFPSGRPERGVIDLSVEQARPRGQAVAIGFLEPSVCDGTSQRFRATLTSVRGPRFRVGAATWSASGYVEGPDGLLQTVFVPPTAIRLTR